MRTKRVTRLACWAAKAKPTIFPISWVTRSAPSIFNSSSTPATSPACVFLSKPPAGLDESPIPRRSGTTTKWSRARSAAIATHISPVSPVPVQQDDRRPLSAEAHVDCRAVGRDVPGAEVRRKIEGIHLCKLHDWGRRRTACDLTIYSRSSTGPPQVPIRRKSCDHARDPDFGVYAHPHHLILQDAMTVRAEHDRRPAAGPRSCHVGNSAEPDAPAVSALSGTRLRVPHSHPLE